MSPIVRQPKGMRTLPELARPERPAPQPPTRRSGARTGDPHEIFLAAVALSLAPSINILWEQAADLFRRLYPADHVYFYQTTDSHYLKARRFSVTDQDGALEQEVECADLGVVADVLKHGQVALVQDTERDARYKSAYAGRVRSELAVPLHAGGRLLGVLNLENPRRARYRQADVRTVTVVGLQLAATLAHLEERQAQDKSLIDIISTLSAMVEGKDEYTEGHCQRIAEMSVEMGIRLGLRDAQLKDLTHAGLLHDIGKIAIPDAILHNPNVLTSEEMAIMKTHTTIGRALLERIRGLQRVALIVEQHHERVDGTGYPYGLKGTDILLEARIISVADAFDAMHTTRPYRQALDLQTTRCRLQEGAGRQFDSDVVHAFLAI